MGWTGGTAIAVGLAKSLTELFAEDPDAEMWNDARAVLRVTVVCLIGMDWDTCDEAAGQNPLLDQVLRDVGKLDADPEQMRREIAELRQELAKKDRDVEDFKKQFWERNSAEVDALKKAREELKNLQAVNRNLRTELGVFRDACGVAVSTVFSDKGLEDFAREAKSAAAWVATYAVRLGVETKNMPFPHIAMDVDRAIVQLARVKP